MVKKEAARLKQGNFRARRMRRWDSAAAAARARRMEGDARPSVLPQQTTRNQGRGAGTFLFPPRCHRIYFSHGDSLLRTLRHFSSTGRLKEASKSIFFLLVVGLKQSAWRGHELSKAHYSLFLPKKQLPAWGAST